MTTTALILSSGKGTRMRSVCEERGIPKHLLPLPNGQTIIGRLVSSLSKCDHIVCTIENQKDYNKFEEEISKYVKSYTILAKEDSNIEYSEVEQAASIINTDNVVQTNGDLIFADGVVEEFVSRNKNSNLFYRGREGNSSNMSSVFDVFNSRISFIPSKLLKKLSKDNKLFVVKHMLSSILSGRVEKVPTLFNVDTPKIYEEACNYFAKNEK